MRRLSLIDKIEESIIGILRNHNFVNAALAMGSCARGEETYCLNATGEKELLSDYEMLIVVAEGANITLLNLELKELAKKLKKVIKTEGFDLDWSIKTVREIKRLDKRFIFYEAKESGRLIYGNAAILESFPQITVENLNFCELNTIIIHRLYHVLKGYLSENLHYQKYVIARNTLDIATAVLPHMGVMECGYRRRSEVFLAQADENFFSQSLKRRLKDYLLMKIEYDSPIYSKYKLEEMKENFVEDMQLLYQYQKYVQNGRPFVRDSRMLLSAVYRMNARKFIQWIRWPKIMNQLYNNMIVLLKSNANDEQMMRDVCNTMMQIFGY